MREQRFSHGQRPVAAQPLPPNPSGTGIPIHWSEGTVMAIIIRPPHPGMATKLWRINLKPGCLQGLNAPFAFNDEGRRILAGMPERRAT